MNFNSLIISAVFSASFLMSGCASKSSYMQNSGFFKDYTQLNKEIEPKKAIVQSKSNVDMSKYKNIMVAPVLVISGISKDKENDSQKKLYNEISEYLTSKYKKELSNNSKYTLVETPSENTLLLETAISAVEVHFDDASWYQFSSVPMGLTVVSYNLYMDEDVRILAEKRLVDSQTQEVLLSSMSILQDDKITINGDYLEFSNIKPALDSWLEQLKKDFEK